MSKCDVNDDKAMCNVLAAIATVEGRMSVMKLGERMVKNFNEMLAMSGKVDFPQQSKCGVRISIRMNHDSGQPSGLVVSAASSFSVPITPLQVFDSLLNNETRHQVLLSFLDLHASLSNGYVTLGVLLRVDVLTDIELN